MESNLPSIVITGASGFIGRYLLDSIKEDYRIFAIARRSQKESDVPDHINITWLQCDIGNTQLVDETTNHIIEHGGVDFILHMAAYYDFENKWVDEYQRTNIDGTKNILAMAKKINVKRFIFISSIAACSFPEAGSFINEKSLPDGKEPYSITKRVGEQMVKEYSTFFPCSVVRLTAVFSDWCEYAPLYKFLNTWLAKKWDSKILGGRGESAIPYIYIHDVIKIFVVLLSKHASLPDFDIYIASPNGSTSHLELFKTATRDYLGEEAKPVLLPKPIAFLGLVFRTVLRKIKIAYHDSFERLWMLRYIDLKLDTDASYTRNVLGWNPVPRYHIQRRMLYLIEKMRSHPSEWQMKNEAAYKRVKGRPGLMIYQAMVDEKEKLLEWIIIEIRFSEEKKFIHYKKMDFTDFKSYMSTLYHLLMTAVRSGDRSLILKYIDDIALRRFSEGFEPAEICDALRIFNNVITTNLNSRDDLQPVKNEIYNYVGMTIQLATDEIEDIYESLDKKMPRGKFPESQMLPDVRALQKLVRQISALYRRYPEENSFYDEKEKENK